MKLTEVERLQQRIMMLEIENSNLKHTLSKLSKHFCTLLLDQEKRKTRGTDRS